MAIPPYGGQRAPPPYIERTATPSIVTGFASTVLMTNLPVCAAANVLTGMTTLFAAVPAKLNVPSEVPFHSTCTEPQVAQREAISAMRRACMVPRVSVAPLTEVD